MTTLNIAGTTISLEDEFVANCAALTPYQGQELPLDAALISVADIALATRPVLPDSVVDLCRMWRVAEWLGHAALSEKVCHHLVEQLRSCQAVRSLTAAETATLVSLPGDLVRAFQRQSQVCGVSRYAMPQSVLDFSPDYRECLTSNYNVYRDGKFVRRLDISQRCNRLEGRTHNEYCWTAEGLCLIIDQPEYLTLERFDGSLARTVVNIRRCRNQDARSGGWIENPVSDDGRYMVGTTYCSWYQGHFSIFEVATGQPVRTFRIDTAEIWSRPDFQRILVWSNQQYLLTDLSGERVYYSGSPKAATYDPGEIEEVWWSNNLCLVRQLNADDDDPRLMLIDIRHGTIRHIPTNDDWSDCAIRSLTDTHLFYTIDHVADQQLAAEESYVVKLDRPDLRLSLRCGRRIDSIPNTHHAGHVMMPYYPGPEDDMTGWLQFMSGL